MNTIKWQYIIKWIAIRWQIIIYINSHFLCPCMWTVLSPDHNEIKGAGKAQQRTTTTTAKDNTRTSTTCMLAPSRSHSPVSFALHRFALLLPLSVFLPISLPLYLACVCVGYWTLTQCYTYTNNNCRPVAMRSCILYHPFTLGEKSVLFLVLICKDKGYKDCKGYLKLLKVKIPILFLLIY